MAFDCTLLYFLPSDASQAKGSIDKGLRLIGLSGNTHASGEHEMRAGMGRFVVIYMVAMEHALLFLLLFAETFLARAPKWVRLVSARRQHEQHTPSK